MKCKFCEAIELQRFISEHHGKPAEIESVLSVALVSHSVIDGHLRGRTTDYMKNGKGYPLKFCPECGKEIK